MVEKVGLIYERTDRLQQQIYVSRQALFRSPLQASQVERHQGDALHAVRHLTGQKVDVVAAERLAIVDGLANSCLKLLLRHGKHRLAHVTLFRAGI